MCSLNVMSIKRTCSLYHGTLLPVPWLILLRGRLLQLNDARWLVLGLLLGRDFDGGFLGPCERGQP